MWIVHKRSKQKKPVASKKPVEKQEEPIVIPQEPFIEEEQAPIVKPTYKIVKKNPYLEDQESDLLQGFVLDEE